MAPSVQLISECFVKPQSTTSESLEPLYLSSWDLAMLSFHYIQKGLLFNKPPSAQVQENFMMIFLDKLKNSLSLTLVHFYSLACRFATMKNDDPHTYIVYVENENSPGAKFIYATALDLTISDILEPTYVPLDVVHSFFDLNKAMNHDGHFLPLLSIQVTELKDGIFIGCSMNHAIGDGTSYWKFWSTWSQIFQAGEKEKSKNFPFSISNPPPLHKRWFPDGHDQIINLPFKHQEEFISRYESPPTLVERIFHFSSKSIAQLKAKANEESNTTKLSSFQSLSAFSWRSITRARNLPRDQVTSCRMAANNRPRMNPPIPDYFFGTYIHTLKGAAKVGDLLENNLGWAAMELHKAVTNHSDKDVHAWLDSWLQSPFIYQLGKHFDPCSVMMGSSPRFNKYANEFGLGKAVAIRSGYANKFDGKITCYPGHGGDGSMDLEICLLQENMKALESDVEFMCARNI